jgi:hypothetical protein
MTPFGIHPFGTVQAYRQYLSFLRNTLCHKKHRQLGENGWCPLLGLAGAGAVTQAAQAGRVSARNRRASSGGLDYSVENRRSRTGGINRWPGVCAAEDSVAGSSF